MTRRLFLAWIAVVAALLASTLAAPTRAAEKADRIFINGRVWTGEPGKPLSEALAVRAQTIVAVGTTAQIQKHKEKETDVVDLKGRFVYPGFGDGHLHLMGGSLSLIQLDLVGASTPKR